MRHREKDGQVTEEGDREKKDEGDAETKKGRKDPGGSKGEEKR